MRTVKARRMTEMGRCEMAAMLCYYEYKGCTAGGNLYYIAYE